MDVSVLMSLVGGLARGAEGLERGAGGVARCVDAGERGAEGLACGAEVERVLAMARGEAAERCGVCCKAVAGCRADALVTCTCGQVMHIPCVYPTLKRSMRLSGYRCEDCTVHAMEEGEFGDGIGGRAAELWSVAMRMEAAAVVPGSHATGATGVTAVARFLETDLEVPDGMEWLRGTLPMTLMEARRRPAEEQRRTEARGDIWQALLMMVAAAKQGRWKPGTVATYFDGLAAMFRDAGVAVQDCPTKHTRVKRVLQALRRHAGEAEGGGVKRAEALDEDMMRILLNDLIERSVRDVRGTGWMGDMEADQAIIALLIGFAGLLRRSELARLRRMDVRVEADRIVIAVSGQGAYAAKSDQERKGQQVTLDRVVLGVDLAEIIGRQHGRLDGWGVTAKGGFFRNVLTPAVGWAHSGEAVVRMLRRCVEGALRLRGMPAEEAETVAATYSGHSLRRGGAQFLRDCGVPRELVKLMGRWTSSAVDVYFSTACRATWGRVAHVFTRRQTWRA